MDKLCKDNLICCDDNCKRCANLVYRDYLKLKKRVKHGEWIFTGKETLFSREVKCNQCETKQLGETPYCPNCGARMDGGNK